MPSCFLLLLRHTARVLPSPSAARFKPLAAVLLRPSLQPQSQGRTAGLDRMALNDGLARFRLQQERNQATLSTIAATKAAASSSATKSQHHPAPAPPPPALAPAAAVARFSDDTARLRKINQVRTSPVGQQLKNVIKLLEATTTEALTARQINDKTYVDIDGNSAVTESLRNSLKVRFDGKRYSYRRTHHIKGKDELLSLIRSFPDGLPAPEVEDAYPSVLEDPNNPRSRMEVGAELKKMFHEVKLPQDMLDIEKELRKNGEKPATDTAKRRAAEQIHRRHPEPEKAKKKPRRITSRTKLTNVHLPGLFDLLI